LIEQLGHNSAFAGRNSRGLGQVATLEDLKPKCNGDLGELGV
jgi:hypothetical protein